MPPLRAGNLRHELTVRRVSEIPNGKGGYKSDWGKVATANGEVTGLGGSESVIGQALQGISVFQIRIRWRQDIAVDDQLRPTGSCFGFDAEGNARDVNIRSIVDPDGKRQQLVIIADTASTRSG
jgi:head-tail adaptor